jgi:high affinity sulfate transporter 1
MLGRYDPGWLRSDLVAGIVLAAILVPQGMAYAELAGLPAVTGLYTTIACLVGYAIFGPSRILVLGPDSSVAPLIFAALVPLLVTNDPGEAIALAGMMALIVGAIEVGLGLGKLGFVADLLSKEVQVGYMNGLAVTIIVGQLPKLFGFSTDADGFLDECTAFVQGLDQTDATALALGLGTLAVLLLVPRVSKKIPAVLVAVVGATVVTGVLDLAAKGVDTVGALPQGLPRPTFPSVPLDTIGALLAASLGIVLVSLTDTIATSTSFAARRGDEVDPNQEMIGMGAANVFAGLFQGFAISASGSRTAVAEQSGSKSQVTGLAGAAVVVLLLLFLPALLRDLPQPALAAIVIVAALSLFNIAILRTYFRMRKSALVTSLIASLGVILFGVLEGIMIAIVLSILLFFRRSWWPEGEVLGRVRALDGWHRTDRFPDAEETEGVIVYRWEAPLFFANAGIFRQEIRKRVHHRKPRWVVLQCEAITDIDVTAADMLDKLDRELNDKGIKVVFVEMRTRIEDLLERYGLFATFTREHVYPSIDVALRGIEEEERRTRAVDTTGSDEHRDDRPEA